MNALLLPLVCAAPVPLHLMPVAPADPIVPGFRWCYPDGGEFGPTLCELEVVRVEGDRVVFRCLNNPARVWQAFPDSPPGANWSVQTRTTTLSEIQRFGVPAYPYTPPPK